MNKVEQTQLSHLDAIMEIADRCGLSPWPRDAYLAEIDRRESIFLCIAQQSGDCCGFILGRIVPSGVSPGSVDAAIYNIGVKPELQHHGLGSKLLLGFIDRCMERAVENIWLEVRESNKTARQFYEKFRFNTVSIRKGFYQNPTENAIMLKLHDLTRFADFMLRNT